MFEDTSHDMPASVETHGQGGPELAGKTDDIRVRRDVYGAILEISGPLTVHDITTRFAVALPTSYVAFDHANRGDAVNHDLYGYDAPRDLAVFQVRHAFRPSRRGYLNTRKTYFLVGFTEDGNPFRHPVGAHAIRSAINRGCSPAEVVRVAERWIFNVTPAQYDRGVRQGDVFMFPAGRQPPKDAERVGSRLVLLDSHELRAHEIVQDAKGRIWAYDPAVYHLKHQHVPVYAPTVSCWCRVCGGREAHTWDFAERLGD
jgi:hypothetical protein